MVLALALAVAAVGLLAPVFVRGPARPGLRFSQVSETALLHPPRGPSRRVRVDEDVPSDALVEVVSGAAVLRSDLPAVVRAGPEALFRYSQVPLWEGGPAQRFAVLPDGAPLLIETAGGRISLLGGAIATLYADGRASIDQGTALLPPGRVLETGDTFSWRAPSAPVPAPAPPPAPRPAVTKALPLAALPPAAGLRAPALRDALAARAPPPPRLSPAAAPAPSGDRPARPLPRHDARGLFAAAGLATLLGVALELRGRRR